MFPVKNRDYPLNPFMQYPLIRKYIRRVLFCIVIIFDEVFMHLFYSFPEQVSRYAPIQMGIRFASTSAVDNNPETRCKLFLSVFIL